MTNRQSFPNSMSSWNITHQKKSTLWISRLEILCKWGTLHYYINFTGKHLWVSPVFNKIDVLVLACITKNSAFTKNSGLLQSFSCEVWGFFRIVLYRKVVDDDCFWIFPCSLRWILRYQRFRFSFLFSLSFKIVFKFCFLRLFSLVYDFTAVLNIEIKAQEKIPSVIQKNFFFLTASLNLFSSHANSNMPLFHLLSSNKVTLSLKDQNHFPQFEKGEPNYLVNDVIRAEFS